MGSQVQFVCDEVVVRGNSQVCWLARGREGEGDASEEPRTGGWGAHLGLGFVNGEPSAKQHSLQPEPTRLRLRVLCSRC